MAGISLHQCGLPGTGERYSGGGPGHTHGDVREVQGAGAEPLEPPDRVHALQRPGPVATGLALTFVSSVGVLLLFQVSRAANRENTHSLVTSTHSN
jgi:hypothetical protein